MPCRGVRGATTAEDNTSEEILKATRQLLALMIRQNGIRAEDIPQRLLFDDHGPRRRVSRPGRAAVGLARRGLDVRSRAGRTRLVAPLHPHHAALEHREAPR